MVGLPLLPSLGHIAWFVDPLWCTVAVSTCTEDLARPDSGCQQALRARSWGSTDHTSLLLRLQRLVPIPNLLGLEGPDGRKQSVWDFFLPRTYHPFCRCFEDKPLVPGRRTSALESFHLR